MKPDVALARYNHGVRRAVTTYRTEQTLNAGLCIACEVRPREGNRHQCATCKHRRKP